MLPSDSNNQGNVVEVSPDVDFASELVVPGAPKIVVIAGPTAVGKTCLGIELGLKFCGEVVNADSRNFYRGMDIGVAKPTQAERADVPHHLIDILDPSNDVSLAVYQKRAMDAIDEIVTRGRLPILVGGTPLYINAVVEGWKIPRVAPNPEFRAKLEKEADQNGLAPLTERLFGVDAIAAKRSGGNLRRVIRALEIYDSTGVPMSELEGKGPRPFQTLEIGLTMARDRLHAAIDRRVDDQIARGLVEEVRGLLEDGLAPEAPSMSALGYRQLVPFIDGVATLDEAIMRIKFDTHRYVRHQETWLRRNRRLISIDVSEPNWVVRATALVENFLR